MLMTLGEKNNDHVGGSTVKGKCHHPLLNPHKCSCWYFPSSFQVPTKLQAKLLFSLKCKQFVVILKMLMNYQNNCLQFRYSRLSYGPHKRE